MRVDRSGRLLGGPCRNQSSGGASVGPAWNHESTRRSAPGYADIEQHRGL